MIFDFKNTGCDIPDVTIIARIADKKYINFVNNNVK